MRILFNDHLHDYDSNWKKEENTNQTKFENTFEFVIHITSNLQNPRIRLFSNSILILFTILSFFTHAMVIILILWSILFIRLFAAKCAKCAEGFNKNDFVMRARNKIYHPDCFCCDSCSRPLVSGDEFALRDDQLLCKVCVRNTHLLHFLTWLSH